MAMTNTSTDALPTPDSSSSSNSSNVMWANHAASPGISCDATDRIAEKVREWVQVFHTCIEQHGEHTVLIPDVWATSSKPEPFIAMKDFWSRRMYDADSNLLAQAPVDLQALVDREVDQTSAQHQPTPCI
jgi:hypothetical protein